MFHLAAYQGNVGPSAFPTFQALTPVSDGFLAVAGNGFLPRTEMRVVAAYAAQANLLLARINAPSLLKVAYPYIRPINLFATVGANTDPNVQRLVSQPLHLRGTESVSVEGTFGGGVAAQGFALLWLCQQLEQVPAGEKVTVRYTTAAAAGLGATRWTSIGSASFDQALPPGQYAVVGLEHWSANGVAARLVFPGIAMRPGTLSMNQVGTRTNDIFYEGGLGVYGTFDSYAPPQVEVLANAADANHEVYFTLIRVGDVTGAAGKCP